MREKEIKSLVFLHNACQYGFFQWHCLETFVSIVCDQFMCLVLGKALEYHHLWLVGVLPMRWLFIFLWFLLHLQIKNGNLSI